MWAPLALPRGDTAIAAPVRPKRNPVIARLSPSPGTILGAGLPSPNMTITTDNPMSRRRAVPAISEKNVRKGKPRGRGSVMPLQASHLGLGELDDDLDVVRLALERVDEMLRARTASHQPAQP